MDQVSTNYTNRSKRIFSKLPPANLGRERIFFNSNIKREDDSFVSPFVKSYGNDQYYYTNGTENQYQYTTNNDHETTMQQTTFRRNNRNDLRNTMVNISLSAMNYAVQQFIPPIHIQCTPKVDDYQTGEGIIDALLISVEQNFRKLNKNYNLLVDFDFWHVDNNGDLLCYTRDIELYVYLCDPQNYPSLLDTTNIIVVRPRHLPWQRTLGLSAVPNYISLEEVRAKLSLYCRSIFHIEELYKTRTEHDRRLRLEILLKSEYDELVRSREVMINGHVIQVERYVIPLRLLLCSKCSEPGHYSTHCISTYEVCRRCGGDKSFGYHENCYICCHRCKRSHMSSDPKCPYLVKYRRVLYAEVKQNYYLLTPSIRIRIPVEYRQRSYQNNHIWIKPMLTNNNDSRKQIQQSSFNLYDYNWPVLSRKSLNEFVVPSYKRTRRRQWKNVQNETSELKTEDNVRTQNDPSKHTDTTEILPTVLPIILEETKYQNEHPIQHHTYVNETMHISNSIPDSIMTLKLDYTTSNKTNNDDLEDQISSDHKSHSTEFIKLYNSLQSTNQTTTNDLVEQQSHEIIQETDILKSSDK